MRVDGKHFRSIWLEPDGWTVGAIDQRRLPHQFVIAQLATVIPGIGMYAAGLFVLLVAAVVATFDPHEVWERVAWADGESPPMLSETKSDPAGAR